MLNPDDAVKELCSRSLARFVREAWHVLEPDQPYTHGWHIDAIAEHLEAVSNGQITRLLINVPPGTMKALDRLTPILTLDGWTNHGDLRPGDYVFGADGLPKRVIACTLEVMEPSYRVSFDDSTEIIAGAAHEWIVEREYSDKSTGHKRMRRAEIVETQDIVYGSRPDRIPVCEEIYQPKRGLLIDPYLLGVWLGDGATDSGCIYAADEDIEHFSSLGEIAHTTQAGGMRNHAYYRIRVPGLQVSLRGMGLLGNKHVPDEYILASPADRLAILQGLIDTDGHVDGSGAVHFTNKNKSLADAVYQISAMLGAKPTINSRYTTLNGKKYGPHYKVSFIPPSGTRVCRLDRKQSRVRQSKNPRTFCRYVKNIEQVGLRPVKCIQVEGGVYLAGHQLVPTHNSMMTAVFWPAWEWGPFGYPSMRMLGASNSADNALRDNIKMRRLIESEWYQQKWPIKFVGDQNQKTYFENDQTGWRQSCAARAMTSKRGDRVLWDDPHTAEDAHSPAALREAQRVFRETLPTRLNNPATSAIIVIMQRLSLADEEISQEIINNPSYGYVHLMLPMEYEPARRCVTVTGFEDPREKEGELLFPERFSVEVVAGLKAILRTAAPGQLQQNPVKVGGNIIKGEWFRRYISLPPQLKYRIIYADTAQKTKEHNDFSVFEEWGLSPDGRVYLIDMIRGKWTAPELRRRAADFWAKCAARDTIMYGHLRAMKPEDKSSGTGLIQELTQPPYNIPVIGIPRDRDKYSRANDVLPRIESGFVYIPESAPFVSEFITECEAFTADDSHPHDDQIDPMVDAITDMLGEGTTKLRIR